MSYTINGGTVLTRQVKLTTTSPTEIIPTGGATLVGVYAAETAGATPTLAYYLLSEGTSFFLRSAKAMTARETWRDELIVVLGRDEKLMAQAGTANQIDIFVAYIPADKTAR